MRTLAEMEKKIQRAVDSAPFVQTARNAADECGIPLYLGGGIVRDLLLNIDTQADFDLYFECNEQEFQKVQSTLKQNPAFETAFVEGKVDVHRAFNVVQFVRQFDFTVNTVCYDLRNRKLMAEDRALQDIQARVLQMTSLPLFATSQRSFVRAFRLAQSRTLSIDPSVIDAINTFGAMLSLGDAAKRAIIHGELMHLFSLPTLTSVWDQIERSRLLVHLFPFLSALEVAPVTGTISRMSAAFNLMRVLEKVISDLPESVRRTVVREYRRDHIFGEQRYCARFSELALLRLSLIFGELGEAWAALDPQRRYPLSSDQYAQHATRTILNESLTLLEAHPPLYQAYAIAVDLCQRLGMLMHQQWSQAFVALKKSQDPTLCRLAGIHLLTRLESGMSDWQRELSTSEVKQALIELASS